MASVSSIELGLYVLDTLGSLTKLGAGLLTTILVFGAARGLCFSDWCDLHLCSGSLLELWVAAWQQGQAVKWERLAVECVLGN